MNRPIYRRKDEWVLCTCNGCNALNYVEPHGTTADCRKCGKSTEHTNIDYRYRDISDTRLIQTPTQTYKFVWSPEGRTLETIVAASLAHARSEFKIRRPAHARFMGEVYVERA